MTDTAAAAVEDMTTMLGCDARTARYYLSLSGGIQNSAVGLFFDQGGAPPPDEFERAGATAAGGGGVSAVGIDWGALAAETKYAVPTALPDGSPLPAVPASEDLGALEAFGRELSVLSGHARRAVHKDECAFGFDTPEAPTGLFLNLQHLYSVGAEFLVMDEAKTGAKYYLHQKWVKVPKEEKEPAAEGEGGGGGESVEAVVEAAPKTVAEHLNKLARDGEKFDVHKTITIYSVATEAFIPYPYAGISAHLCVGGWAAPRKLWPLICVDLRARRAKTWAGGSFLLSEGAVVLPSDARRTLHTLCALASPCLHFTVSQLRGVRVCTGGN
jgi:hypothetical protein